MPLVPRRLRALRRRLFLHRHVLAATLVAIAVVVGLRVVSPPEPSTVPVLVAARDLPAGVELRAADLVERRFPPGVAPSGLAEQPVGRILAAAVNSGEALTDVRLVGPELARARPGEHAVPVRLPDAGMAGLLRPGDRVDLFATDPADGESRLLATDVTVLALPSGQGQEGGSSPSGALVVLSLTPDRIRIVTGAALAEFLTVAFAR